MPAVPIGRRISTQLLLTLLLVWASDHLLYGAAPGLGVALLTLLAAACILVRLVPSPWPIPIAWPRRGLTLSLVMVLGGALAVSCSGSALAQLWCLLAVAMLSLYLRRVQLGSPAIVLASVLAHVVTPLFRPFLDAQIQQRLQTHRWTRRLFAAGILRWLAPLLLGAVFSLLFAWANPVIAVWCSRLWEWLTAPGLPPADRCLLWLLAGLAAWSLIRARWGMSWLRLRRADDPPPLWRLSSSARSIDVAGGQGNAAEDQVGHIAVVVRCLVVCNMVFLIHNGLDVRYLWGHTVLPDHMTYAAYAQQGAHVLVLTALLAAGFILAWFRPGGRIESDRRARLLVFTWLLQNVVLLAGSAYRLSLYIDAYGLTRWRLAAGLWMIVVMAGILLIAWRIFRRRRNLWLVNANIVVVAGILACCSFLNLDSLIAWQNVTSLSRSPATASRIDLDYLTSLGSSSIPALEWLSHRASDTGQLERIHQDLRDLSRAMQAEPYDWRCYSLNSLFLRGTP